MDTWPHVGIMLRKEVSRNLDQTRTLSRAGAPARAHTHRGGRERERERERQQFITFFNGQDPWKHFLQTFCFQHLHKRSIMMDILKTYFSAESSSFNYRRRYSKDNHLNLKHQAIVEENQISWLHSESWSKHNDANKAHEGILVRLPQSCSIYQQMICKQKWSGVIIYWKSRWDNAASVSSYWLAHSYW